MQFGGKWSKATYHLNIPTNYRHIVYGSSKQNREVIIMHLAKVRTVLKEIILGHDLIVAACLLHVA